MTIGDVLKYFENFIPLDFQETYDNSGLQVGNIQNEFKRALITLDISEEVLDEAIEKKCNLIISHHPLIFNSLKKITGSNSVERIIEKAIKNNITIYSSHTCLDNNLEGINNFIATKLGLKNIKILVPAKKILKKLIVFCPVDHAEKVRNAMFDAGGGSIGNYDNCSFNVMGKGSFRPNEFANQFVGETNELHFEEEIRIELIYPSHMEKAIIAAMLENHPYEEVAYDIYPIENTYNKIGSGIIGDLEQSIKTKAFLTLLKQTFGSKCIKHNSINRQKIQTVAFCGGSGSFLINQAILYNADIFVTSDIKYHDFFNEKILLADIGHFESEQFFMELIASVFMKKFHTFAFLYSEKNSNPVNYF